MTGFVLAVDVVLCGQVESLGAAQQFLMGGVQHALSISISFDDKRLTRFVKRPDTTGAQAPAVSARDAVSVGGLCPGPRQPGGDDAEDHHHRNGGLEP
ncbi:hypothetical protein GCM10010094_73190 [Streptomyces flaveus]|uniref:Uncharacterized protein n=1 Tax=Streptomyces flaveus TaxID=66370 RepID=A0A917RCK7_9ACTN|nr:hypothetical protein GCM10010094_73190 [Streptomyces flaveus]